MNETSKRVIRTFIQLVAAGGLTALFDQFAKDVPAEYTPYVLMAATLIVTLAQNYIEETTGKSLLK